MLVSRDQNVGQNQDIQIANRSSEHVSQFKYLGTTVTSQNLIWEEIKRRFNSDNACYHSVQNLLSSRLLFKNVKIRIYKNAVFWDVTPCGSYKNQHFGGTYRLHHQADKNQQARNNVSSN
jgi:hypothetical protein